MEGNTPFFSVVIPLYNKGNYITTCLDSVLNQDFSNFEIIIVDDGSTDDSINEIKKFDDERIIIEQQENKGAAAARNKGVEIAKAKWIAFLDADDLWLENHLAELFLAIQEFPKESVFTSRLGIIRQHKQIDLAQYNFKLKSETQLLSYFENSIKSDLLNTSGIVIEKAFFKKMNGFDEQIYSGQDTDLFIRIGLKKKIVFSSKNTFLYCEYSENNISKTPRFKERLALLDAYQLKAENNPALEKYLDLNRFSIYLRSKMYGDDTWKQAKQKINKKNLTKKQLGLMLLPKLMLQNLKYIQLKLSSLGIKKSVF